MRWSRACLLALLSAASCRAPVEPFPADGVPADVLFVGNSFTYYNNSLHNHYRKMVRERLGDGAGQQGRVRAMTISGGKLREHRCGLEQRLDEHAWHAVVLQGHSNEPLLDRAGFEHAAVTYAEWIRAQGARPVLLMTWAYTDAPEMTAQLRAAYTEVGARADAQVVPVGLAFAAATERHAQIRLRIGDRKHPTRAGTYLAACTMFAALRKESPIGLAYTAGLPETVASTLQQVAWQSVQEFDARPR